MDLISRIVAAIASTWFLFTGVWGMFGIPGGGHYDAGSACDAMISEQIVRWKILYPAWGWYTGVLPTQAQYVCHHPFGIEYISALCLWIFGHHDFVIHLPAVLMSAAIPPLLYGIAKERWGASIGAVAAAAYVVVPIAVGFSGFWALETPCIFGALLFFWGHSRHMTTGADTYLVPSLVGLLIACSGDWAGYLLVAPTLVWAMCRAFVFPPWLTPSFLFVPYARWWALSVAVAIGSLLGWIWLFHRADHVNDWLSSGEMRGLGSETTKLADVLRARAHWIDFSFTPLAIAIGKVAAPVCLLRLVITRRDEETYAPGFLFGAVFQYVSFKQGADIHIFWPHYFAPYFALALAQLAATLAAIVRSVASAVAPYRAAGLAAATGLVIGLFPVAAMAHDGVESLWVWRRTGGRYDDNGNLIRSHKDMLAVIDQLLVARMARDGHIDAHPSASFGWEHQWRLQANPTSVAIPTAADPNAETHPFWIARGSGLSAQEEKKVAESAHVRVYGDTWLVDQREPAAPLDAYSLNEREPHPLEWLFLGGTEPVRTVGRTPDPWLTWEWREHLGQGLAAPTDAPTTIDQVRIAHNAAVVRGDAPTADRWRVEIEQQLDRTVQTRFTGGMHLIGVRMIAGVQPRVEAWFECTEAPAGDAVFNVKSTVEARAPFSLIPPDEVDREMAYPHPMATKLWRPGFLYRTETVLNHRIGRERYWGYWASRDGTPAPRRVDGAEQTTLTVLP